MIVAASANNAIGIDNDLPWHISEDLKRFKLLTMGKPMIMGRKTYESIGRPLPGRRSIVMTTQADFLAEGCEVVHSPEQAVDAAGDVDEVMVIGGGKVYDLMMPLTKRIYITHVHTELAGDTFFPVLSKDEWESSSREDFPATNDRPIGFSFEVLDRRQS